MVCANADISCKQLMQTDAEAAVLCLINEQRAAVGVAPLTLNLKLVSAARQQAKDAATIKWWGPGADVHTNPVTGSTPAIRIKAAGYCPGEEHPADERERLLGHLFHQQPNPHHAPGSRELVDGKPGPQDNPARPGLSRDRRGGRTGNTGQGK